VTAPLILHAPLDGWCDALATTPDEVFAAGMMGEGLAIDPTSATLLAPCAGEIVSIPASRHAVSLRTACGVEILIHIGIDTVGLGGAGFTALVVPGAQVVTGEKLIAFDLDRIARGAKSLVTPIVVTAAAGRPIAARHAAGPIRAGEMLLSLGPALAAAAASATAPSARLEERHRVALCLHDMEGSASGRRTVGPFVYVRFHGAQKYSGRYADDTLDRWADWLAARSHEGCEVFGYFNNDIGGHAPRDAVRLRDAIAKRA